MYIPDHSKAELPRNNLRASQSDLCAARAHCWSASAMRGLIGREKYYWHVWYLVDARGKMTAASPSMKLASTGIEFAAGIGRW